MRKHQFIYYTWDFKPENIQPSLSYFGMGFYFFAVSGKISLLTAILASSFILTKQGSFAWLFKLLTTVAQPL